MRRLAIFSGAFALGTAACVWLFPSWAGLCCGILLLFGGVFLCVVKEKYGVRLGIAALGLSLGLLWSWGYEQIYIVPLRDCCGLRENITVEVLTYPEKTERGCRVEAELSGGRVQLYLNKDLPIKPGDRVSLCAEVIDVSRGIGNENNLYYQSKDISLLALQVGEPDVVSAERIPVSAYPTVAARWVREKLTELFPEDVEGFARALLTGDKSGLSYNLSNAMSLVGISHVVAVSGMHVSLLIGLITSVFRRRSLGVVISFGVMVFFAAMLGFGASVTRAIIMNTVLLAAPLLKRENDLPTSLSFALLLILIENPWSIANVGLQLSFAAVAGIALLTPSLAGRLHSWLGHRQQDLSLHTLWRRIAKPLCNNFAMTIGATAFTLPIIATIFGTVSLISPLTNLLLLMPISLIFTLLPAVLVLGVIWTPLGSGAAWLLSRGIRGILWAVQGLAKIPFAAVSANGFYVVAGLISVYALIFLYLRWRRTFSKGVFPACLCGILVLMVLFGVLDGRRAGLTMLDVGQGQCILFRTENAAVMVDCGGSDGEEAGELAARQLLMSGILELDALILTHYDTDHVGGVVQLLSRVKVTRAYVPDILSPNRESVLKALGEAGTEIIFVTKSRTVPLPGGSVSLFSPRGDADENNGLAVILSIDSYDIMVTGDMDIEAERELLREQKLPDVEVLVAGHHGSKYSTSSDLLQRVMPETVLISVGENTYGHPTAEVLERIEVIGAAVYRTDLYGDITITR